MAKKATTATRPTSWWPHEAAWNTPEWQDPRLQTETLVGTAMAGAAAQTQRCTHTYWTYSQMLKIILRMHQHFRKVAVKMSMDGGWAFDGSNDNENANCCVPTSVMNWNTTTHHCHEYPTPPVPALRKPSVPATCCRAEMPAGKNYVRTQRGSKTAHSQASSR